MKIKKLFTILAIILVAIMAFAPIKSLAATGDLTITVTGDVGGRTLSVYKLFDLTVTGTQENPIYNYSWAGASEEFFAQLTDANGNNLGLTTVAKATDYLKSFQNNSTELTKIAEDYYAYCKANNIDATVPSTTIDADATSVDFTVPGQGYYLIYDETTSLGEGRAIAAAMLSNVTENMEVALKAEKTTVEKKADKVTAAVGETVNYTVTSQVPNVVGYDSYTFIVTDKLSKGLTLNDDIKVTIDGVEYTLYDKKIDKNVDGTTSLTLTFDETEFAKLTDKIGKEIKVTYSAVLNADAAEILDNTNEVKITYSNDPNTEGKGETPSIIVHVYTYSIDFTKKNTAGTVLSGAEFVLRLEDGTYATFDNNGVFTGTVATREGATVLTSDANGKVAISGLKAGTYTLVETKAPEGYSVPNFEFTFTIDQVLKADGTLETASFDYITDEDNTAAKGYMTDSTSQSASFAIDVLNAKEGALPTTGGMGTKIFTVVGISIMAVAVVALVARNRKND